MSEEYVMKSIDEVAQEVINGEWGGPRVRKKKLEEYGYNSDEVLAKVSEIESQSHEEAHESDSEEIMAETTSEIESHEEIHEVEPSEEINEVSAPTTTVTTESKKDTLKEGDVVKFNANCRFPRIYRGDAIPQFILKRFLYVRSEVRDGTVVIATTPNGPVIGRVFVKDLIKIN